MSARPVFVAGVGLATSLGHGVAAHAGWRDAAPVVDASRFAPYPLHPLPALPFADAIPRRESRQMEDLQRLGTFAAGLALAESGWAGDAAAVDLVVACGGGERDAALDAQILAERPAEAALHAKLMAGLRPTLFLAQLSNLLAGSISIVHGVAGSSRTLLGEEWAGAEALRMAAARIAAGSSARGLVGGAFVAERPEILLLLNMGGGLHAGRWCPMDQRDGIIPGSAGAFLALSPEGGLARLAHIGTDAGPPEGAEARLDALLAAAPPEVPGAVTLWAGGARTARPGLRVADAFGHAVEAAFPLACALAALLVRDGVPQVRVAMAGPWRGEAVAVLESP